MFNAYEFTFDGQSSVMYGLMLYDFDGKGQEDVPFGTRASIVETRLNNRITPLHFGVNYHEEPLEFKLVFGSDRPMDRYELENVAMWLLGHQDYKWLTIDQTDMERFRFRCLITELTPLSHGWLPVAFEATIRCDCSYAYGYPFVYRYEVSDTTDIVFTNESSVAGYFKPIITFNPSSGNTLKIKNRSDGDREFVLSGLTTSTEVYVDSENGIIQDRSADKRNLYGGFNLKFPRMVRGENRLTVTGTGTLTISGQFLHNIAG